MRNFKALALAFLLAIVGVNTHAAVNPNSAITPQTPQSEYQNFVQGTDTAGTYKTVYTAGVAGSILKGVIVTSNDASVAHLVTCQINNGSTGFTIAAVNIPVSSGYTAAALPVNLFAPGNVPGLPIDNNGNPFIYIPVGSTFKCTFATALTTSDQINIVGVGADY